MSTDLVDLSGAKILIVDDVPSNLDLLSDALETEGYEVSAAPGGEVALRLARSAPPDLMLLDVRMPGMDGFEVCRRLKADAATRDIPVVYITAHGQIEEVVQGFQAGGVDYILKPFRKEEVLVRVRTRLERAHLVQALARQNEALEQRNRDLARANEALLAEHFLRLFSEEMGQEAPGLSRRALEALADYDFPGNVRELKNMIERALLECDEAGEISPHHLQFLDLSSGTEAPTLPAGASGEVAWPDFEQAELEQIKQALTQTRGNIVAAARLLGTNRMRIYRLLRKHNLMPG